MSNPPPHLKETVARIREASVTDPPAPWERRGSYAVGGLEAVGFARGTDLLLVVSSRGRSVIDCTNGLLVSRDSSMPGVDEPDWYDCFNLEAQGIGPTTGVAIPICGLHGGGLPLLTTDGWVAERLGIDWPDECLLLVPPGSWIYGLAYSKAALFTKVAVEREIRAWGFSGTGLSLVLATSSDLTIFSRARAPN